MSKLPNNKKEWPKQCNFSADTKEQLCKEYNRLKGIDESRLSEEQLKLWRDNFSDRFVIELENRVDWALGELSYDNQPSPSKDHIKQQLKPVNGAVKDLAKKLEELEKHSQFKLDCTFSDEKNIWHLATRRKKLIRELNALTTALAQILAKDDRGRPIRSADSVVYAVADIMHSFGLVVTKTGTLLVFLEIVFAAINIPIKPRTALDNHWREVLELTKISRIGEFQADNLDDFTDE